MFFHALKIIFSLLLNFVWSQFEIMVVDAGGNNKTYLKYIKDCRKIMYVNIDLDLAVLRVRLHNFQFADVLLQLHARFPQFFLKNQSKDEN